MNTLLFAALLAAAPAASAAPAAPPPADGRALAAVAPGPNEIVAKAPAGDWVAIAPDDLLVMDLAPDANGGARLRRQSGSRADTMPRRVVIQLMPAPFSQGWVGNIRKLAAAHWWDGMAVTRVQDNYVAQWGDPEADDPAKAKQLPAGLATVGESEYTTALNQIIAQKLARIAPPNAQATGLKTTPTASRKRRAPAAGGGIVVTASRRITPYQRDPYGFSQFMDGWPMSVAHPSGRVNAIWPLLSPIHCYGMVGVGRNLSPDTGSGAELYAVIGHAPRHLDRNIALVGRVIAGIEHLSSLPRGSGPLGFYDVTQGDERVAISSVRLGGAVAGLPRYQYLSTESASFARYADARANRHDAFFIRPAGGADICNVPVPVRVAP